MPTSIVFLLVNLDHTLFHETSLLHIRIEINNIMNKIDSEENHKTEDFSVVKRYTTMKKYQFV